VGQGGRKGRQLEIYIREQYLADVQEWYFLSYYVFILVIIPNT